MGTYTVWCEHLGQEQSDGKRFSEGGPREAATAWAQWHDQHSAEYGIASGRETEVCVYDERTGAVSFWTVRGEAVPTYWARPVKPNAGLNRPGNRSAAEAGGSELKPLLGEETP